MPPREAEPRRSPIRLPRDEYRAGHPFSITIATHERYRWFEVHPKLGREVQDLLAGTARERGTELFAWCIMPDHIHILAQDADVVEFVRVVKGRVVPLARRAARGRRLWQRSFYDHALREPESIEEVAKYIFENPVRAELVDSPERYELSGSLYWPDWRALWKQG